MKYFNYHKTAKKLIKEGKLICYYLTENHNGIKPALVLVFNDKTHPVMPIRKERFEEYDNLLSKEKLIFKK
jgi:hypothetical protein